MSSESSLNPKNRGLGRGLDALFESNEVDSSIESEQSDKSTASEEIALDVMEIIDVASAASDRKIVGIEEIKANPDQPRKIFDDEALTQLADSLKVHGILQPLVVRTAQDGNGYQIIAGERRWRAAQLAQLHEVPIIIREMDNSQALQIGLVENLQREDLNPIEEALGYRNLIEEFGYTQKDVAHLVGKSRSQVTNMMRLLSLPQSIQNMVEHGEISTGHARALIGKDNAEALAEKIIAQGLSVRDIENSVSDHNKKTVSFQASNERGTRDENQNGDRQALEKEMADILGLDVKINLRGNGHSGDIKFLFKSLDQLDFILHKLKEN